MAKSKQVPVHPAKKIARTKTKANYVLSVSDMHDIASAIADADGTDVRAVIVLGRLATIADKRKWIPRARAMQMPQFVVAVGELLPKMIAANRDQFAQIPAAGQKFAQLILAAKQAMAA